MGMRVDIVTLFPEMCQQVLDASIIGRAAKRGYIETHCHQIRDYTLNKQKQTDDYPYGGGCGMVLYPEKVLMHPITKKICQKFGIDPYRLISSGSMLIACDDGEGMVKGLAAIGIPAAVIGKAVESGVSTADGTEIPAPEADELYKII
mgnify:CR=1 FL=1